MGGSDTYTVPFFIGGEEVVTEKTFEIVNPATGKAVHRSSSASDADALAAVEAAAKAFPAWRDLVPRKRRDILLKAAEVLEKRRDELAGYMIEETGVARGWADFNLDVAKDFMVDVAGRLAGLEGTIPATQDPAVGALILKEPYGVILAIAPW